jgi:hypothetical protein
MKLRVGFEMLYDSPQPTPIIMVLGVHFTRASDVIVPDFLTTSPVVEITPYRDMFGNWCSRMVAPAGRMRLAADEPDKFQDQYETALVDLINQKRAGRPITPKERPRGENVVDLMEALRRSVGGKAAESEAAKKPAKKPRKAAAGQKEMLMPIAGKKPAKESAAKKLSARSQRKSA